MPRSAKKKTDVAKVKKGKECTMCHEIKAETDFYTSSNPMFADRKMPFCKECCRTYPLNNDGSINYARFRELLMRTDLPLYYDCVQKSYDAIRMKYPLAEEKEILRMGKDVVAEYIRRMSPKSKYKTFTQSEKEGHIGAMGKELTEAERQTLIATYAPRFNGENASPVWFESDDIPGKVFEITPEMRELFGDGFTLKEYQKMNKKYNSLKMNYQVQTSLHQEALITYVRFKVKEEDATAKGKVDEARKWYNAAQDAADKAKLSPKQLTKADLQKGLNSFSEISQAMEQAVDIIEILPRYKSQPVDSVDFNIWCYINYARKLKGLSVVDYSDIYKFYDDMKEEYLSQYGDPYGIFEDDTTVNNRENVEKFITLPVDYEDMSSVGDDEEDD